MRFRSAGVCGMFFFAGRKRCCTAWRGMAKEGREGSVRSAVVSIMAIGREAGPRGVFVSVFSTKALLFLPLTRLYSGRCCRIRGQGYYAFRKCHATVQQDAQTGT